jgi:hypothetical protein
MKNLRFLRWHTGQLDLYHLAILEREDLIFKFYKTLLYPLDFNPFWIYIHTQFNFFLQRTPVKTNKFHLNKWVCYNQVWMYLFIQIYLILSISNFLFLWLDATEVWNPGRSYATRWDSGRRCGRTRRCCPRSSDFQRLESSDRKRQLCRKKFLTSNLKLFKRKTLNRLLFPVIR